MLRITLVESPGSAAVLRLEGRIIGPWVGELGRACERVLVQTDARLTLDLAGVSFMDGDGIALVRSLLSRDARDVTVTNGSPFVAEQLRAPRRDAPAPADAGRLQGEGP